MALRPRLRKDGAASWSTCFVQHGKSQTSPEVSGEAGGTGFEISSFIYGHPDSHINVWVQFG
jgi:hypothetical protein